MALPSAWAYRARLRRSGMPGDTYYAGDRDARPPAEGNDMDFWDLTRLMVRRWYIAMPLLLLTFVGTGYVAVAVKPDYVLTSYIQLIPPSASSDPNQVNRVQNPWLALGLEALSQAATVATQDQTFLDSLSKEGNTASFSIELGDRNPVATIAVVAPTLEQATSATETITKYYSETVTSLQTQYAVRQQDMITSHRLDKGENVKRPGGKVKRAVVVVFATGLLFTAGFTILFDALVRRRRRKTGAGTAGQVRPAAEAANGASVAVRAGVSARVPNSADTQRIRTSREYRSAGVNGVGSEPRVREGNGRSPVDPAIPDVPADATIVLPRMPRKLDWGDGGDKGRRG
jgi:hypothetical protein